MTEYSQRALSSMFASETGDALLALLTITHRTWIDPETGQLLILRFVSNTQDITSNGEPYIAYPFGLELPDSVNGNNPSIQLKIGNTDRRIVQKIRAINTPLDIEISLIFSGAPDEVIQTLPKFILRNVSYDQKVLTGTLVIENFMQEPYPAGRITPNVAPSIFS